MENYGLNRLIQRVRDGWCPDKRNPSAWKLVRGMGILLGIYLVRLMIACQADGLIAIENTSPFLPKLSQYDIFQGAPANLKPSADFHLYELASTLFTDYAQKQRLIKLPAGTTLTSQGDGLPSFPVGTMIVKTFYYDRDQRDPAKGNVLIETRLLVKTDLGWNVATYLWADNQQEATLVTSGLTKTVNWIDERGNAQVVAYHIPSNRECTTCHQLNGEVVPIGPKLRNLNRLVSRDSQTLNQLDYLQKAGILRPLSPASVTALPDYSNATLPLTERARAYVDINCAHCHNAAGYAASTKLFFSADLPYDQTAIASHKDKIIRFMVTGNMPRLGTTVVDQVGLTLLKSYIASLP